MDYLLRVQDDDDDEMTCCSKLRHPTLANVIGVCMDTRQPYVIVEFVDGEALRDIIRRSTGDRSCSWVQRIKVASFSSFCYS